MMVLDATAIADDEAAVAYDKQYLAITVLFLSGILKNMGPGIAKFLDSGYVIIQAKCVSNP